MPLPPDARVTTVIVHYRTPDLLDTAVRSFRDAYPAVPLLIIDNGTLPDTQAALEHLCTAVGGPTTACFLTGNIYHGPAMHLAMETAQTPYVFLLDSDTQTHQGGFLEPMIALLEKDEKAYGAGQVVAVNSRGFAETRGAIPVLVSAYMLLKRARYADLPPFIHHGLPVLQNFRAAAEKGYHHHDFPIGQYIEHFGRGTAERYGYGLGLRSRLDFLLNRLGW